MLATSLHLQNLETNLQDMQRRTVTSTAAQRIRTAMAVAGATEESVAKAADIALDDLNDRLNGRAEFQVAELVQVGGFLRMPLSTLIPEAA